MDAEMETRSQDGQQNMSLGEIKAMLAATVMKLNTQRELSAKDQVHERTMQALTPPTEPVGRAKTGEAFQA
jgi:hypothetical protein